MSTRILIGPFKRRVFADGLKALLADEPGLTLSELSNTADVYRHLKAETPTILILEHGECAEPYPLPVSPAVGVILVSQDGADVQIAIRQPNADQLRAAIGLVEETDHPKVVTFAANKPEQPPCVLPRYRRGGESSLTPIVRWLDVAFARMLRRLEEGRGEISTTWAAEIGQLMRTLAGESNASPDDEQARFDELLASPLWQQRLIRNLDLDAMEIRAICLASAPDLDQKYAAAVGILQNDYNSPRPSASTLARFLSEDLVGGDFDAFLGNNRFFSRFALVRCAPNDKQGMPQPGFCVAAPILELMLDLNVRSGQGWWMQDKGLPAQPDIVDDLAPLFQDIDTSTVAILSPGYVDGVNELCAGLLALGRVVHCFDARGLTASESVRDLLKDNLLRARLNSAVLIIEGLDAVSEEVRSAVLSTDLESLALGVCYSGVSTAPIYSKRVTGLQMAAPTGDIRKARWLSAMRQNGIEVSVVRFFGSTSGLI